MAKIEGSEQTGPGNCGIATVDSPDTKLKLMLPGMSSVPDGQAWWYVTSAHRRVPRVLGEPCSPWFEGVMVHVRELCAWTVRGDVGGLKHMSELTYIM